MELTRLTLGLLLSVCLGQSETDKCEPIRVPLCTDMSYSQTVMPNVLGHTSQEDAGLEAHFWTPLVKVQCSPELKSFLCSVYVPECVKGSARPVCRTTCEKAKAGCHQVLSAYSFSWPDKLDCKAFSTEGCEKSLTPSDIQRKLVQMGHTVDGQGLSLQTVRVLMSLKDEDRTGKFDTLKFLELQNFVSAAKTEFIRSKINEMEMKKILKARDLQLNELNFSVFWERYSTAGLISYDDFVAVLARLETLKERFKSHRMTNLPCDCVMATFSLDDFIRDTLL